jgi:hypothetical protein
MHALIFTKNGLGYILGDFLTNSSGHPVNTVVSPAWQNVAQSGHIGTNVIILKIFSLKNLAKKIGGFFSKTTASFAKNIIITLVS